MYSHFFDLKSVPFNLTPDTECFFAEGNRKAILEGLIYTINKGDGITKVVGEVGSGKTLLSRLLADSLPAQFEVLYLLNPRISADKILYAIAIELNLDVDCSQDKVRLLHSLHTRLLELHQLNKQTVLLIDEAQTIPLETLEEIRMLSNLETGRHKLLQIVLFGQPELDQKLNKHEVRQIKERIIHSFYLPPLTSTEVNRYLYFRMQKAGFQGTFPFSKLAVKLITLKSDGFLRRINILADKCLLIAFSQQSRKIGLLTVLQASSEDKSSKAFILASFALVSLLAVTFFYAADKLYQKPSDFITPANPPLQLATSTTKEIFIDKNAPIERIKQKQPLATVSVTKENGSAKRPHYAIQLLRLALTKQQDPKKAISDLIPAELWKYVYFYSLKKNIYQIFLGDFTTYQKAKEKLSQLPISLKKNQPFISKIKQTLNNRTLSTLIN